MVRQWMRRSAGFVLVCGVATAVVAVPAPAVNDDLTIFSSFLGIDGATIGTGGDGSVVLFSSYYSLKPFETPTAELDLLAVTSHTVSAVDFPGTPVINLTSNGFLNGDEIRFTATTDTMPDGILLGTTYFVVNVGADTFEIASLPGGASIQYTDGGNGTHSFVRSTGKPYAADNDDLFSWAPGQDQLLQFTVTGDVDNDAGSALAWRTHNETPVIYTRTGDARDSAGTRLFAAAYATNADPELAGPINPKQDVSLPYRVLGASGRLIAYTDSDLETPIPLVTIAHDHTAFDPSVVIRVSVTNRGSKKPRNFRTLAIKDAYVAFAGNADNNQDNLDGNDEIHLWTRSEFLASADGGGIVNNAGIQQITHTTSGDCWAPAVSVRGDIAFLSDANITGGNPDGSVELFVYRRRRGEIRQVTAISPSRTIDAPSWGDNGHRVVFESNADPKGTNGDASTEIFVWNGAKIHQVTNSPSGSSFSPSMDPFGRTIAFLTDAPLPNVVYGLVPSPEVVVTNWPKRHYRQVTQVDDGFANETPTVTRNSLGRVHVTFVSSSNLDGRNSNHNRRIYRATVR